nr:two-component system protein b [Quercus suber]
MRIPIREQLAVIIVLTSLICLGVVSVATWITERNFTLSIRASRLSLSASLKAGQLSSNLNLMQTSASFVSTRVLIQSALLRYDTQGNNSAANWAAAQADLSDTIDSVRSAGSSLSLQAVLFPRDATGPAGSDGLLNVTTSTTRIRLPWTCPDGSAVFLGTDDCGNLGYPPALYPNLTYSTDATSNISSARYDGETLDITSTLLLGPIPVNETFWLTSLTLPIINNTSESDILGWLTVVMDASLIQEVLSSRQGVDSTGETLLVGPAHATNTFAPNQDFSAASTNATVDDFEVRYVFPLNSTMRHPAHAIDTVNAPFPAASYPAIQQVFTETTVDPNQEASSMIEAVNEAGQQVSVGYDRVDASFVDWAILVEQARSEVWQPINHLRNVLLACVFATAGLMALIAWPLAYLFSLPIRRLREATLKTISPPVVVGSRSSSDSFASGRDGLGDVGGSNADEGDMARKEGFITRCRNRWKPERGRGAPGLPKDEASFRIPGKVKERKLWVRDELSDLTRTFNEMSDELLMQYNRLEERVQQRTAELEISKKAAEAANESKTLFIANISHELKTPLNGILGMCAVCMQEDDPTRLKRSLGIIYKSGDLLLNLLTDLLTFSKNQVGQHLTLEEKEFRLRDISSQILAIFDKQAKDSKVDLRVEFEGLPPPAHDAPFVLDDADATGPAGTGRLKDMILYGDIHRILQVCINLVSNAIKFTSSVSSLREHHGATCARETDTFTQGSVVLTIRCLSDKPANTSRQISTSSRQSKRVGRRYAKPDGSPPAGELDAINSGSRKARPWSRVSSDHELSLSPSTTTHLTFEFEVTDTGPGIPEHFLGKIFEPFMQGDLGLSRKHGGTGLGLSICSQLASLMHGSVTVRSTVGEGSTFTMKIPLRHLQSRADSSASSTLTVPPQLAQAHSTDSVQPRRPSLLLPDHVDEQTLLSPDASTSAEAQPRLVGLSQPFFASSQPLESPGSQPAAMQKIVGDASRSGRIRVLVAEDNKVNQEVVLRMLKLEDIYDVTVANDGQEAVDMIKESMRGEKPPYNLVFMDVQMPNVDGLQSTRLIREIGYQAPIVALTAFAEESNIKDCMDSGMNYFLSKPIRRPQLKKVLKEYCAPIPEETEDPPSPPATPPHTAAATATTAAAAPNVNTTIVLVSSAPGSPTVADHPPLPPTSVLRRSDEAPLEEIAAETAGGGAGLLTSGSHGTTGLL